GGLVGAVAAERSRLRSCRRRRRLKAGNCGTGGRLAIAARRSPRPYLAGRSRLPRRRDPQPRHPRLSRRVFHLPRWGLHRAPRFGRRPSPLAERGWFVTGNRVLLSPALTAAVLRDAARPGDWSAREWIGHRMRGDVNRLAAVLRLPLGALR